MGAGEGKPAWSLRWRREALDTGCLMPAHLCGTAGREWVETLRDCIPYPRGPETPLAHSVLGAEARRPRGKLTCGLKQGPSHRMPSTPGVGRPGSQEPFLRLGQ